MHRYVISFIFDRVLKAIYAHGSASYLVAYEVLYVLERCKNQYVGTGRFISAAETPVRIVFLLRAAESIIQTLLKHLLKRKCLWKRYTLQAYASCCIALLCLVYSLFASSICLSDK